MTMGRAAMFVAFALGICVAPVAAHAQSPMGSAPQIQTAQTFLMTWSGQKWEEMKAVAADAVTIKVGPAAYTPQQAQLSLPFRGLSTLRTDGKITGVKVDEIVFKVGDQETRGSATIDLAEDNGAFRVTGVTATTQHASTQQ